MTEEHRFAGSIIIEWPASFESPWDVMRIRPLDAETGELLRMVKGITIVHALAGSEPYAMLRMFVNEPGKMLEPHERLRNAEGAPHPLEDDFQFRIAGMRIRGQDEGS